MIRIIRSLRSAFRSRLKAGASQDYGPFKKTDLRPWLPEDPVILEAGAHLGEDTREFKSIWPQSTIHCFEPVPSLYLTLSINTGAASGVFRYPFALSSKRGWQEMVVSGGAGTGSSSLLRPKDHLVHHPEVTFEKSAMVPTISLDDWAHEFGVRRLDLLWLDLQGHELTVLKGGQVLLSTVRALFVEVNLVELYEGAPLYPELKSWLGAQGFYPKRELLPYEDAGNVLFLRGF